MPTGKTDDELAIREVLDGMYRAVWAKDYEAFASFHVQADYARRWAWWMPSTLVVKEGWDAISARIRQVMADPRMPDDIDATVRRDNFNLRIMGDMAWVTFEQATPSTQDWSLGVGGYSREMRVLERHDGEWKIAFFAAINRNRPLPDMPRFKCGGDGRILWRNAEADTELADGNDLVVRNGCLRARGRDVDRSLQAAIKWASAINLGFAVERGAVPILPEPAEGAPPKVWWVTADAGVIEVTVNDRALPDHKLALAAAVFGLSPAQSRIASGIAAGREIPELAIEMGVSSHTARTHLRRLFDKTGVRTQTALVRALLSVSAPE